MSISARRLLWFLPLLLSGCGDPRRIAGAMVGAALPLALGATALFWGVSRLYRPAPPMPWRPLGWIFAGITALLGVGVALNQGWVEEGLRDGMLTVFALALLPWWVGSWLLLRRIRRVPALLIPAAFVLLAWQLPALVCMADARKVCEVQITLFLASMLPWEGHTALMMITCGGLLAADALWSRRPAALPPA